VTPKLSVIVPTYNRKRLLLDLLETLAAQTMAHGWFEVLVMDNGSIDGTAEAVAEFKQKHPSLQLEFHVMPFNGGPVYSRNRAVGLARGQVLFFTDSDVIVSPDWLERGLAPFERDPEMAMVSGPTLDKPNQPHRFFSVGTSNRCDENPIFPTSNVVYRKAVFEELGGFDLVTNASPWMGVAMECSDVDLAWKVIDHGYRTEFLKDLMVFHEVRVEPPVRWFATQMRVLHIPMIVRRHPGARKSLLWFGPFAAPENLYFYIAVVTSILALVLRSPWWLLGLLPLYGRFHPFLRPSWVPLRWPKLAAQFVMILIRQTLICGLLLYGSVRSRQVVL